MPDDWEFALCLDPCDSNDRNGDRDSDGYTNIEEYINWLPLGEPMPTRADLNCDGTVDFYDFSEFAARYLSSSTDPLYDRKYDFNDDGVISIADLSYIVQDWLLE
jgi:Ca2+-binding EF-hand superfamily protein